MLMNLKNFTLRSERLLVIALLACSTPHAFAISMVSEDSHNPVVNQQDTHVKGAAKAAVEYADRAVIHAAFPSFPAPARSAGR